MSLNFPSSIYVNYSLKVIAKLESARRVELDHSRVSSPGRFDPRVCYFSSNVMRCDVTLLFMFTPRVKTLVTVTRVAQVW